MNAAPQIAARSRWGALLSAGFGLLVLTAGAYWGGALNPGPLLYFGVGVLLTIVVLFGLLISWLYFSPLPQRRAVALEQRSAPLLRQMLSVLVIISGACFVTGAFWDELWHRQYNTPFGEDFWWRPHQLIYGSLGLGALFALGGLAFVLRGRGDLRRRFRAEPAVGLLAIMSAYLMFSAPIDPIWHEIYGVDISAWSLPHILLAVGFSMVMLVALGVQLSLVPRSTWRGLRGLSLQEGLALIPLAWAYMIFTQVATAEWEGLRSVGRDMTVPGFWSRPEWLYPVVILLVGIFIGQFAIHALKRVGAATMVGILVLSIRALYIAAWGAGEHGLTVQSHLLMLVTVAAIDLVYAVRMRSADVPLTRALASLGGALMMFTVGFFIISQIMVYPRINAETIPGMIFFGVLIALAAGQVGATMGGWIGGLQRSESQAMLKKADLQAALRVGLAVLAAFIAFVIWFATTATPPVT